MVLRPFVALGAEMAAPIRMEFVGWPQPITSPVSLEGSMRTPWRCTPSSPIWLAARRSGVRIPLGPLPA